MTFKKTTPMRSKANNSPHVQSLWTCPYWAQPVPVEDSDSYKPLHDALAESTHKENF